MSKTVLISNSHIPWGGLGQFSINLVKALKEKGYDVYGLITHNNDQLFETFKDLTIHTYYCGNYSKPIMYLNALIYIKHIFPDFIIENYHAPVHFLFPLIQKPKKISIIHSDQIDYYRIANINSKYINHWIAPTPKIKESFIHYANNNDIIPKISIIPHGVDIPIQSTRELNNSTFRIAFVGSLYQHKGVDLLPEIFSKFKNSHPNTHLTIVGDGELKNDLKDKFNKLGLSESTTFTGVIKHNEVLTILSKSDTLIFPTRIEAFGLAIIEAMMEGAVPIVSLIEGVTDSIVQNNSTGYLVEINQTDAFINRLSKLYESRTLLNKMSTAAKHISSINFSSNKMATEYDKLLMAL
jgi:glycosyltransferase involved in cell wall biosynthesis